uniref:Uncharacterized protein n=1 Tax=Arundo donax TaxID=35708 RepID=A0A0A8Y9H7_ARUDO
MWSPAEPIRPSVAISSVIQKLVTEIYEVVTEIYEVVTDHV